MAEAMVGLTVCLGSWEGMTVEIIGGCSSSNKPESRKDSVGVFDGLSVDGLPLGDAVGSKLGLLVVGLCVSGSSC